MYLPWLGLFDRIYKSDVFVMLDNVNYSKNYFINRNKIKTHNGWTWLTVPIISKGHFGQLISDVKIDNTKKWQEQHWKSIYYSYSKAQHFKKFENLIKPYYEKDAEYLCELNIKLMLEILKALGIKTKVVMASELKAKGKKEELILNICKDLGATEYLSGPSGKDYLNPETWDKNGIRLEFQYYSHPVYPQLYGEFMQEMSIIDLMFNCGDESLKILSNQINKG